MMTNLGCASCAWAIIYDQTNPAERLWAVDERRDHQRRAHRARHRRSGIPEPHALDELTCLACARGLFPGHEHVARPDGEPLSIALPFEDATA